MNSKQKPMATSLDTMTFPLHGARLIEASAGTGKTFTIAGLYLRLLLGHGTESSRHQMPLTVEQILVVTFTEAATAELRDRVRSRIHQARIAFLRHSSNDPVIAPLLLEITDHQWAAQTLLNAERSMDEAAIFTIHGFCQRMLTQNAFESGSRFSNEFITDESKLKQLVVCDYWRRYFYSLPKALAAEIDNLWASPEALLKEVGSYLTGVPVTLTVQPMVGTLEQLHQQNLNVIEQLKTEWRQASHDIADVITASDVSKRTFSKKSLPSWIEELNRWANSPTTDYRLCDKLVKFRHSFLIEKTKQGEVVPCHPVFDSIEQFLSNKPSIKEPLIAHAIEYCRLRLAETKRDRQWLSFDDLLTQLSDAINGDESGQLTSRIKHLYPVAMIDEFQDTDPLQYQIFSRIYLQDTRCGLFMIGDPKQAIYAFRGADIFTYIQARNEVADHYTLGTNWRSSADMVQSVNQLFKQADSPFLYDDDIPFIEVSPSKGAEERSWCYQDQRQDALTFWLLDSDKPLAKGDYLSQMAQSTAVKIKSILDSAENNSAYFSGGKTANKKKVEANNIAVLVRTGSEARLVKQQLASLGVSSVYLSNRDSVFVSPIAQAVLRILNAVLNPDDDSALRAALASHIFAYTSVELDALNVSESKLEQQIYQFQQFHKLWKQRGVMPMLRTVMTQYQIAENILAREFGERELTDYLHLSELLQQASTTLDSEYALLRWFSDQIEQAQSGASGVVDDQIQRLESERNLVQIVTIHKSKGLEYDLVFLPFLSAYREAQSGKYYDSQQKQTIVDITNQSASIEKADKERLAEDLRLLYVAVTRAVYGCFIGVAPLRKGRSSRDPSSAHLSAIGYLIQNGESLASSELNLCLQKFSASYSDGITVEQPAEIVDVQPHDLPEQIGLFDHDDLFAHGSAKGGEIYRANQLKNEIDRQWRITSYSALVKQGHSSHRALAETIIDTQGVDIDAISDDALESEEEQELSIYTFPKGARAGTFLHTLFEQIEFTLAADSSETTEVIIKLLDAEQLERHWLPVLQKLIDDVLNTHLNRAQPDDNPLQSPPLATHLQLGKLASNQKLVEMEFLLPIVFLSSSHLAHLSQQYDHISKLAGELGFHTVQGMIKGFIDLIFEHQGKFYVLDWKSNFLGDQSSDYGLEALERAMAEHRYDLQYQIYSLALHRYLSSRITDYDYDLHFGGVYYLFLRGIEKQGSNGIFFQRPDKAFIQALDALIDADTQGESNA
ncbi:exodeoxyribonuclease V subunit beta [Vibrio sp. 99-8-1]|uniref:exodeoxyribonuclease V subunit beta n=1 Tax=Vibrio sp. 99-8-1 TaxID=2607602 RepID=UPI001493DAAC|nr:exodeoxyribonuclease V subunit beta [Vibrio sp. 99-8-1]NOI64889.1 exodeoxyribonuclease V subunit beta [Vibrio sp. 99-8-1]